MAKNNWPALRVRVSMEMPVTAAGSAPTYSPSMAASNSSLVQSVSDIALRLSILVAQGQGHRVMIAEGDDSVADDLAGFMPLARHHQHIALGQPGDARIDRRLPVADL